VLNAVVPELDAAIADAGLKSLGGATSRAAPMAGVGGVAP